MTTTDHTDPRNMTLDDMDDAVNQAKAILNRIQQDREGQPERLAKARAAAEEARGWSLIEEPWETHVSAIPTYNSDGRTGDALTLPNITAKELYGARLAFDMLDCGDDFDRIDEVQTRYFQMVGGDTSLMFLLAMSALSTIAGVVVPQMLDDLEHSASNYDARVLLAEARRKSWEGRVSQLRELSDEAEKTGVLPIDGYDIASNAFDPDDGVDE